MLFPRSPLPVLALLLLLAGSLLAGCGVGQPGKAQTTASPTIAGDLPSGSDAEATPVLLSNPSPSQLEVNLNVTMGGYDPTTRDLTTVSLGFQSGDTIVQFTGRERLTCNGNDLALHDHYAVFEIANAPSSTLEGHTIRCTYSAGGVSSTFTLTIPHAPAILSPHDQAQVHRAAKTLISYEARGGQLLGIVALCADNKALAQLNMPGPGQATVDTSAFSAGAGSLSLTQVLDVQITQTGTPFKALNASGMGLALVSITWI